MVRTEDRAYIGGRWWAVTGDEMTLIDPVREEPAARITLATPADAATAVRAATAAFDNWAGLSPASRGKYLAALRDGLMANMTTYADLISSEVGTPRQLSLLAQVGGPIAVADSYATMADSLELEFVEAGTLLRREPVGVVAAITPWNYPLHQIVAKLAPALVAGCTVVWKPSEVAPLSAYLLMELVDEIGLPPGVVNMVPGHGAEVGEALASDPNVDLVSFTGSTQAGRRVAALAADNVTRVALELGGKSALVVLDDADLTAAVTTGISACYLNNGQTCAAWTRLIVPRDRLDEAAAIAAEQADSMSIGAPTDPGTVIGPLVTARQRDRVRAHIQQGVDEGAQLITGGTMPPTGHDTGFYVQPTVFSAVTSDMTIAQEEIFGPVLSVMAHDDDDHAVALANDTVYGLHGGVYGRDAERALAVARRMRTGTVDLNGIKPSISGPFGGYKRSGLGRELGRHGLEEYFELKGINR